MGNIGWADIKQTSSSFNSNTYFKLDRGETKAKFRPIGDLYIFKKYMFKYANRWRIAVCLDESSCPVAAKHNIVPSVRYALNVIDRRDNVIKILETSIKVVRELKVFFEKTGKAPGSVNGAQYCMSFLENKSRWAYTAAFSGPHALSDKDVALIKQQGLHNIKKIYKATDPSKIEDILFGDMISDSSNQEAYKENKKLDNTTFSI